jgi:type VI secretion system protein ImpL
MAKSWTLATLGLVAFAVLVWVAGPLLVLGGQTPLASPQARLLVVGVFSLQYFAQKLWNLHQARRHNQLVVAQLKPSSETGLLPEAARLRERFATALAELRRLRFSARGAWRFWRSYLYELPWYMIIGAPGAGKTTALLNSGLSFPLAGKLGRGPVGGVGGTRNCDWWFTDRAVLIDTAGRYTTHESDGRADRQGWEAFLDLLLHARPRRPLNGVLVAVSLGDLLEFDADQLAEHARILRARLEELQSALRVRIPVYVLVTKCDLLPGFVDWFGTLARKDSDRAWGVALDLRDASSMGAAADFTHSFELLVSQLADGLLERLRAERDLQRRGRLFALPGQLRTLSEPLADLVRVAFGSSALSSSNAAPFLRGIYLTSGTQEGSPIDRMLSAFGRELGLERQILPPNPSTGKSFFLAGLLNDVVLAETELSGRTPRGLRWQRRILLLSILLVQLSAFAVAAWWVTGYLRTVHYFAQLDDDVSKARSVIQAIPASPDPDPRSLLPALNSLRALIPMSVQVNPAELIDVGARSRQKLAAAAREAYNRMLLGPFQGRIAGAIDTTMRIGADENVQYEALKAYVMLSSAEHFDGTGLKTFVMSYWDAALAPPLRPIERNVLADHVDALLNAGAVGSGIRLDPLLVDSVRRRLSSQSGAERIALRLTVLLNAHPYADFTVASVGPAAAALFVGTDGRSAPKPVPGKYTIEAYRGLVSIEVPALASQLAYETKWVLGVPMTSAEADAREVMASYRTSYSQAWSELIDDLHLKAASGDQEAVRQAQVLGDPAGPLPLLLDAIVSQTPLRLRNGIDGPIASADPFADRFLALAKLVARDTNGRAPLGAAMQSFRELEALRRPVIPGSTPVEMTAPVGDRLSHLITDARREPEPVRSMLLMLAVPSPRSGPPQESRVSGSSLSRQIATRLGVACIQLVAGHFPFDRGSPHDASFADFSRLFAPEGAFDEVFGRLLASRVEVSSSDTWRALAGAGPDPQDLERFRSAARIRDVFFAHGGAQPAFQLTFKPLDMDGSIDRFQLEVDGQTVRYAHGPPIPTVVKWPGPSSVARIELTPAGADAPVQYNGPWALFRLLDHAAIREAGSPGRLQVVFDVGGRRTSFEVATDNGANPFRLRELEHFDCPIGGQ